MGTKKIGYGIVVASGDPMQEATEGMRGKRAAPKDFFATHGISPPSCLFETMEDTYYFAKDLDGRFVWHNRLLQERHHLREPAGIIGKCDHDFLRREIADRIRADDIAVMEGRAVIENKVEMIGNDDGMQCWLCTTKKPLRNRRGEVIGVEGLCRSILHAPVTTPAQ